MSLLVVTEDGYAKRVKLEDVPLHRRGAKGVRLSSTPVAAVIAVHGDEDVVIVTAKGMVERVAAGSVPTRRRPPRAGRAVKGVRVVKLDGSDRVASAAPAPPNTPEAVALARAAGLRHVNWPWGSAGLREGERVGSAHVFSPPRPLDQIQTGGRPVVPRDEWAKTTVHQASNYFCAHCGQQREHPEAVYACIDRHAEAARANTNYLTGVKAA